MTIEVVQNENSFAVTLTGRLDIMSSPELEKTLDSILDNAQELVLDFHGIAYISSAGLRVLLKTQKVMAKRGGMKLVGVTESVAKVFSITGIEDLLTIE